MAKSVIARSFAPPRARRLLGNARSVDGGWGYQVVGAGTGFEPRRSCLGVGTVGAPTTGALRHTLPALASGFPQCRVPGPPPLWHILPIGPDIRLPLVVFPVERLKVVETVRSAFGNGPNVVYLPTVAFGLHIAIFVAHDQRPECIDSQNVRIFTLDDSCHSPHSLDRF